MKCKDIEISVVSGNPFAEDKLNRQPLAQNLTDIANMYADTGAVIALYVRSNNIWCHIRTKVVFPDPHSPS
ncbi:hypothetical protein AAH033_20345, partial [Phocaeicola vulgatus]